MDQCCIIEHEAWITKLLLIILKNYNSEVKSKQIYNANVGNFYMITFCVIGELLIVKCQNRFS